MKKFLSVICIIASVHAAMAQQKPYYTQYILNNYILNPAVTGIENYTELKISNRNQWSGLDGAPVTSYLTIHKPIGKAYNRPTATSFVLPDNNPYKSKVLESAEPATAHHGIGLTAISDKTGYISRTSVGLSYAYHKPIGQYTSLAAGLIAGFTNVHLDRSKIVWGAMDPNDPAIGYNNGDLMKTMPELGAGLWLYNTNFFFGTSVLNIVPGKVRFVKNPTYGDNFHPHIFVQTGYRHFLSDDISILPSVAVQYINPLPVFVHANLKIQYQDLVWLGAGYRFKDELSGAAIMAGINIAHAVNIGYSYNSTINSLVKTYAGNTHEVVLGFTIGKKDDICPKNVW